MVDALVGTAKDRFNLDWSQGTAETALAAYIDKHGLPLLAASIHGGTPEIPTGLAENEYAISVFVGQIIDRDPQLFEYLDEMVKGSMLASALYMDAPQGDRHFENTTLYIDTPLCIMVLGLDGPEAQLAVTQVLDMAKAQGAFVACFEHSVREMRGILDAALHSLRRGRSAGTPFALADRFREDNTTPSDVERIIDQLRSRITEAGITIEDTPPHSLELGVDEIELESLLTTRLGYYHSSADALIRDLNSLTAIHRLRNGSAPRELERCRALLVTNNTSLVAASREYFDRLGHEWPVVMSDNDIATLLWVKEPQSYPDVPRTQVIADCVAALSPSNDLWELILKEVDRLAEKGQVTTQDIAIMRYAPEARHAFMDATLGDARNVTPRSTQDALRRIRDEVSEPVRKELEAALQRAEAAAEDQAKLQVDNLELQSELKAFKCRDTETRVRIRGSARVVSRRARNATIVVVVVMLTGCVVVSTIDLGPWSRWASGLTLGVGLLTGLFGSISDLFSKNEERFRKWVEKRKLRAANLPAEDEDDSVPPFSMRRGSAGS